MVHINIEMPTGCRTCPFRANYRFCMKWDDHGRAADCPLMTDEEYLEYINAEIQRIKSER